MASLHFGHFNLRVCTISDQCIDYYLTHCLDIQEKASRGLEKSIGSARGVYLEISNVISPSQLWLSCKHLRKRPTPGAFHNYCSSCSRPTGKYRLLKFQSPGLLYSLMNIAVVLPIAHPTVRRNADM